MIKVLSFIVAIAISFPVLAADFVWTMADTNAARSVKGVGAAADTFGEGATDGMALANTKGFAVWVCADLGETITTAFVLTAYAQHPYLALWGPAPIWDLSGSETGVRCEYLDAFPVFSPAGRVGYAPSAGAVSSGDVTIWIVATGNSGELI
jgi:hypothetical protein